MTMGKIQDSRAVRAAITIASMLPGLAVIATGLAWLLGGFNGVVIVQHDITNLSGQLGSVIQKVGTLSDKLDLLPRHQDLDVIDRHLSLLDGRADGFDGRLRLVEADTVRARSDLDNLKGGSSGAPERRR